MGEDVIMTPIGVLMVEHLLIARMMNLEDQSLSNHRGIGRGCGMEIRESVRE